MEDTSSNKNLVKRSKKKKATVNGSLKIKKFPIYQPNHKRANSEHKKKTTNQRLLESGNVINLITKLPSINKLFFKNDNVSLKSDSVPKMNKNQVKKFRSIHIDKGKNDIYNNIIIKNKYDSIKKSNIALNFYNMDCIEKIHNLKGEAKDFQFNSKGKKSKKLNYINKSYISNDKLFVFNNVLNTNPMYNQKENKKTKKPVHKIQSLNQEKRQYKFSEFKVIEDLKKEEEDGDDESLENINPEDYREGNNIQLIEGNSFSEGKDESSSLSSDDNNNKEKKEKKKTSDKLSNLINQSIKDEKKKIERQPSQNNYNSNYNSEVEDNYFKNEIKFFMSPKVNSNNSNHPSNKSLKSDYFNNNINYFNDSTNNNNSLNKNSLLGGPVNKNKIRKNISITTNSNYDYEGDNEEGYDLNEFGNKIVNNLTANDSFINIKSTEANKQINNENESIDNSQVINNINNDVHIDNMNNKNFVNNNDVINNQKENNIIKKFIPNYNLNEYLKSNLCNNNIDTNNALMQNQKEFPRNFTGNPNKSNIINIHNMNNFNNNNYIYSNNNSNIKSSQHNLNNNIINSMNNNIGNNINISQNNTINYSRPFLMNNNLLNCQGNPNVITNEKNYNINNYIINNKNKSGSFNLNQLEQNNQLINDNNNKFIDFNYNQNRYLLNNSNYYQSNLNNNISMNSNNNFDSMYNNNNRNSQLFYSHNQYNSNNIGDNNMNINYLNYINSQNNLNNELNNNMNSIFIGNNQINYNSQKKKKKKYNNYINQNFPNQNIINLNNPNITNNNSNQFYNNYINQNNSMNLNNNLNINNTMHLLNFVNGMNNPMIQNNSNIKNRIVSNPPSNNLNIINPIGNINQIILNDNNLNINNNIPNKQNKQNNYQSNKQKKQNLNLLSNEELSKQAFSLAKYKNGCRYLQKRVENNPKLVKTLFFPNILGHITELSNDQFGNYYIKIIIKYLPEDMLYILIQLIHPSIAKIGTNQYGTKVIQYLIEFLKEEKNLSFFIEKTLPHIVVLINDLNGIHIVQRLICTENKNIQLIYDKIFENIELIAVTRDGSNFIKKLIEFLDVNNMIKLINVIDKNLSVIITNQCGNYIIQNIILKDNFRLKYSIIETIIKNIVSFSNQKFSSNVVEKCLDVEEMKNKVIDEIIKTNNFELILLNEYGNYVVQKALNKSDQNKQYIMFKLLIPLIHKLQCLSFGQKLLGKLFILYPRLSIFILNSGEQL